MGKPSKFQLYGEWNGSVPGIMHGELVNKSRSAHFAPLKETQNIEHSCTNLTYPIFSTEHFEVMQLRVNYETKTQVLINVTLLACPPGFQLSTLTAQCECAPLLKERGLLCSISGATPLVQKNQISLD